MNKPLSGIKVLELATFVAAPSCCRLLADLGAEVIKVEHPRGDGWRPMAMGLVPNRFTPEENPVFDIYNSGKEHIAINLKSVYLFCKYGIPLMLERGGSIINTASSAGMIGIPNCDAYTATKGAIVQLTKSLAAEYGRYNIRTNCISPAAIMTPMVRQSNPPDCDAFDENAFLKLRTPLRRYGTPE